MKLIIAGGRDFVPESKHIGWLDEIYRMFQITEVVSGTARGADHFGEQWAVTMAIPITRFPAKWKRSDGMIDRSAGHKRNAEMANYADALVLFPGGKGTMNMYQQAIRCGLTIWDWRERQ